MGSDVLVSTQWVADNLNNSKVKLIEVDVDVLEDFLGGDASCVFRSDRLAADEDIDFVERHGVGLVRGGLQDGHHEAPASERNRMRLKKRGLRSAGK